MKNLFYYSSQFVCFLDGKVVIDMQISFSCPSFHCRVRHLLRIINITCAKSSAQVSGVQHAQVSHCKSLRIWSKHQEKILFLKQFYVFWGPSE